MRHEAPQLAAVGAACPDHLVHTQAPTALGGVRPRDRRRRRCSRSASSPAPRRTAPTTTPYVERYRDAATAPADPEPARRRDRGRGPRCGRRTRQAARLSRDLYHRAIEVMARRQALGGFVSLTTARASRSSTGRSSSTSCRSRRRRASSRAWSRSSPARPAASAARSSTRCAAGRVRRRLRPRRRGRRGGGRRRSATWRRRRGRRHDEDDRRAARSTRRCRVRRRRHRRLECRDRVERSARGDDARRVGAQPRHPRRPATSCRARGRSGVLRAQGTGGSSSSSDRRTRSSPARTRRRTRRRRPRSCTSLAAWPRRAGLAASASTPSIPTRCSKARGSGTRAGARSGPPAYGIAPDELEEHYREAHDARGERPARGRRRGRPALRLARALGQEHRQRPQRRRRRARCLPALEPGDRWSFLCEPTTMRPGGNGQAAGRARRAQAVDPRPAALPAVGSASPRSKSSSRSRR